MMVNMISSKEMTDNVVSSLHKIDYYFLKIKRFK